MRNRCQIIPFPRMAGKMNGTKKVSAADTLFRACTSNSNPPFGSGNGQRDVRKTLVSSSNPSLIESEIPEMTMTMTMYLSYHKQIKYLTN
eukprot:COSAG02_NODE_2551_length_8553_cov_102.765673_4_plen_90_part_00